MSTLFVKLSDCFAYPLLLIFTKSLYEEVVPDSKRANVTAVFKSESKHDPSNYRPISLTVQVCKVLETILKYSITKHSCKHGLIIDNQRYQDQSSTKQLVDDQFIDEHIRRQVHNRQLLDS